MVWKKMTPAPKGVVLFGGMNDIGEVGMVMLEKVCHVRAGFEVLRVLFLKL